VTVTFDGTPAPILYFRLRVNSGSVLATDTLAGSVTAVAQIQIQVPAGSPVALVPLEICPATIPGQIIPIRGLFAIIWSASRGQ
jgi:hypothetical protein